MHRWISLAVLAFLLASARGEDKRADKDVLDLAAYDAKIKPPTATLGLSAREQARRSEGARSELGPQSDRCVRARGAGGKELAAGGASRAARSCCGASTSI